MPFIDIIHFSAGKGAPLRAQNALALVGHEDYVVELLLHHHHSLECLVSLVFQAVQPSQARLTPQHLCLSVQLEDLQTTSHVHVIERNVRQLTSNLIMDTI